MFETADGLVVLMGDVTGKGVGAAVLTATVRHSARAAALLGLSPAQILSLVNRLLVERGELSLVTALVARLVKRGGEHTATLACAGHPFPLLHRGGAQPAQLGEPGIVLGFDRTGGWPEQSFPVEAGDTLVFFTDGVTEMPGVEDRFGERRLREVLARCPADAELIVRGIDDALGEFRRGDALDDVAVLAAQLLSE